VKSTFIQVDQIVGVDLQEVLYKQGAPSMVTFRCLYRLFFYDGKSGLRY